MLEIPVIRWGKPYESMDQSPVVHFETGEELAKVHQANGGIIKMDMRKAKKARDLLRQYSIEDLIGMCEKAADYYVNDELPMGNGTQTPEEFCRIQSASTGLPEHMCKFNMGKSAYVMRNMGKVLDALTRGLPLDVFSNGYGEEGRGINISYQATTNACGWVLPSNSPGVHTLWLPVIPLQIGLVLKPGSSEPWTPYRMFEAMVKAGIPREAFCLYPGPHECGSAIMESCERSTIFGGQATVDQHAGNPKVAAHGPGYSKIVIGEDKIEDWEKYIDLMVDSLYVNSGRSCISASGIWVPKYGAEIADAIAKKLGAVGPKPMTDPESGLAAFTMKGAAEAMNNMIDEGCKSPAVTDVTAKYRDGERLIQEERCDFLLPTVLHVTDPDDAMANTEFMFPFGSVVECPQDKFLKKCGYTLVCTAITDDEDFKRDLIDATNVDRLNIGEVRTYQIHWMQPHEGNIIDFLFRNRAFQTEPPPATEV
ncbi:aldehyde dehydrogenase family protein [Planctomycetaceae bacterium]|jgi:acyl-CoA reductase-like NAD-dependent aldehyde dehydrogenase|nr:aldehyde dehydrogenase family protein [Planctomycetaceae bacterium]